MAGMEAIKVKELPSGASRVFSRVGGVKISPLDIYGNTRPEDMAIFAVSPADPTTRDDLKQVLLSFSIIQADVCETNGIPLSVLSEPLKKPAKNASKAKRAEYLERVEKIGLSLTQIKQVSNATLCDTSTREMLSRCVTVENYKEIKEIDGKDELVLSEKSNAEILQSIPDVFIIWLFEKVQMLSNLTTEEVLGL